MGIGSGSKYRSYSRNKTEKYLEQNMAAADIPLSKENRDQLNRVFKETATAGIRYAAPRLKKLGI